MHPKRQDIAERRHSPAREADLIAERAADAVRGGTSLNAAAALSRAHPTWRPPFAFT